MNANVIEYFEQVVITDYEAELEILKKQSILVELYKLFLNTSNILPLYLCTKI